MNALFLRQRDEQIAAIKAQGYNFIVTGPSAWADRPTIISKHKTRETAERAARRARVVGFDVVEL